MSPSCFESYTDTITYNHMTRRLHNHLQESYNVFRWRTMDNATLFVTTPYPPLPNNWLPRGDISAVLRQSLATIFVGQQSIYTCTYGVSEQSTRTMPVTNSTVNLAHRQPLCRLQHLLMRMPIAVNKTFLFGWLQRRCIQETMQLRDVNIYSLRDNGMVETLNCDRCWPSLSNY